MDVDCVLPLSLMLCSLQYLMQVTTAAVEQYTGEGEPPYCEMTLRATDIAKTDDSLQLPVTLIGVRGVSSKFVIKRALVDRDGIPRCASLSFNMSSG